MQSCRLNTLGTFMKDVVAVIDLPQVIWGVLQVSLTVHNILLDFWAIKLDFQGTGAFTLTFICFLVSVESEYLDCCCVHWIVSRIVLTVSMSLSFCSWPVASVLSITLWMVMLACLLCRRKSSWLCLLTICLTAVTSVTLGFTGAFSFSGSCKLGKSESSPMPVFSQCAHAHSFSHLVLDMTNALFNYVLQNTSYCLIDFVFNFFIQIFKFLRLVSLVILSFTSFLPPMTPFTTAFALSRHVGQPQNTSSRFRTAFFTHNYRPS